MRESVSRDRLDTNDPVIASALRSTPTLRSPAEAGHHVLDSDHGDHDTDEGDDAAGQRIPVTIDPLSAYG